MAARNIKSGGGGPGQQFDPAEKMQSNTLKRHPKMDLSKTDLLRLLSYLEGELQARDISIAALKTDKAKQLLYQAKYGRFGLGDPFMALQRDSDNLKDNSFDESAIKSMYDNQLAQLENLIATQRKAQLKMREQSAAFEKRYQKVCGELDDEKMKHARDTAQGDDVAYMLEKERERLRQEIDYEKSQVKKLEKDLKKTLASLEEERANSAKHKQVALMLIKERKKLIERILLERHKFSEMEEILDDEKNKTHNMAEGLVQESKKSLKMEAAMEKQLNEFDLEKEQLKSRLSKEENKNKELELQVESLQQQLEIIQKQLMKYSSKDMLSSIEIKSTVNKNYLKESRDKVIDRSSARYPQTKSVPKTIVKAVDSPDLTSVKINDGSPRKTMRYGSPVSSPERVLTGAGDSSNRQEQQEIRVSPIGAVSGDKTVVENYGGTRLSVSGNSTSVNVTGGKISFQVGQSSSTPAGSLSPKKVISVSRGTPPPIPPNKPILISSLPGAKPGPPPKVAIAVSKDRISVSGSDSVVDASPRGSPKPVQIPINVVHSTQSGGSAGARTPGRDSSPMRKATQCSGDVALDMVGAATLSVPPSPELDFLGPEMADLQQLITSITADSDNSHQVKLHPLSSLFHPDLPTPLIHRLAATGNLEQLKMLIAEENGDAAVNLSLADGTTPLMLAAQGGYNACMELLLSHGAKVNDQRANLTSPLHAAASGNHISCLETLLKYGADINMADRTGMTPLHWAALKCQTESCCYLLDKESDICSLSQRNWSPVHYATEAGHVTCVQNMICYRTDETWLQKIHSLGNIIDRSGCTIFHIAVSRNTSEILEVLMKNIPIDVMRLDSKGQTVVDVASDQCRTVLDNCVLKMELVATVHIEMDHGFYSNPYDNMGTSFAIGTVMLLPGDLWIEIETKLEMLFTNYMSHLDLGLKTKKTSRLDPEVLTDGLQYSLGLTEKSIKHYVIGSHTLVPRKDKLCLPYEIMCNNGLKKIVILLRDGDSYCDAIAFDVLFPPTSIQNYLRLLNQYKSVVFYGPEGTGKSHIACQLAHCLACKEKREGRSPAISHVQLHADFTHDNLLAVLQQKGCILPKSEDNLSEFAPILVFEDFEKINVAKVFGKLLDTIEHRGKDHCFKLSDQEDYYYVNSFYLLATMNKSRSIGLELSVQQRFRWVHFRLDVEPMHSILARFLLRGLISAYGGKLPAADSPVFRAVEWIICIWQRLNDGLAKLGLSDMVFGPTMFYSCPFESGNQEDIFSWLYLVWNNKISPVVRNWVVRWTGKDSSTDGRNKVANTALYVLMQRAIVPGLPLVGQEKEKYLLNFAGSNELDISMKVEKNKSSPMQPVLNIGNMSATTGFSSSIMHGSLPPHRKNRNSFGFENRASYSFTPNIKRRSLSDDAINREELIETNFPEELEDRQAKVAKLELFSPISFSHTVPVAFSATSVVTTHSMPSLCPAKVNPINTKNSLIPRPTKKSRSSENLSTDLNFTRKLSQQTPASPFSFLLTTTTSSLNSFKYLEVKSSRKKYYSEPDTKNKSPDKICRSFREGGRLLKWKSVNAKTGSQS